MDYFLPSDIARLVLGYLKESGYIKSYTCLVKECPHLLEYYRLLKDGRELHIATHLNLLRILDEWGRLKYNGSQPSSDSFERKNQKVPSRRQTPTSPSKRPTPASSRCRGATRSTSPKKWAVPNHFQSIENDTSDYIDSDCDSILNITEVTNASAQATPKFRGENSNFTKRNLVNQIDLEEDGLDNDVTKNVKKIPKSTLNKTPKSPHKDIHVRFEETRNERLANSAKIDDEQNSAKVATTDINDTGYPVLNSLLNPQNKSPIKLVLLKNDNQDKSKSALGHVDDKNSSENDDDFGEVVTINEMNKNVVENTDGASNSTKLNESEGLLNNKNDVVRSKCLSWMDNNTDKGRNKDQGGVKDIQDQTNEQVSNKVKPSAEAASLETGDILCMAESDTALSEQGTADLEALQAGHAPPAHVTPNKKDVSVTLPPGFVTPIKLFTSIDSSTAKSPHRKKLKTPKKRTSDVHVVSPVLLSGNVDNPLPIFQQILSDTRLHEKLAATCNMVSGQLKLNHSGNDKSGTDKNKETKGVESKSLCTTHGEELETVLASKSLEEILDMDTNFATDMMSENIDMTDPAFTSLFKLFGTDKESFNENLKKETKKTDEMTKEVEELEKSIHEMVTYMNSPQGGPSPQHLPDSQDIFMSQPEPGHVFSPHPVQTTHPVIQNTQPCSPYPSSCADHQTDNFTPLLRQADLGSSPMHSTPCQLNGPFSRENDHPLSPAASTSTQPFSPSISECSHIYNPTTPSSQALTPRSTPRSKYPLSPFVEILNTSQHFTQPESPYVNHSPHDSSFDAKYQEGPKTPTSNQQHLNPESHAVPSTPTQSFAYAQDPSTPRQGAMTPEYTTTVSGFHQSTPVRSKNKNGQLMNGHIAPNCSPLVKADLHAGSPTMVQKLGPYTPQARKCILTQTGTNRLLFSPTHSQNINPTIQSNYQTINQFTVANIASQLTSVAFDALSPIMESVVDQGLDNNNLMKSACTDKEITSLPHVANGEKVMSVFTGTDMSVQNNPCSTIENTIGCISLPEPHVQDPHDVGPINKGKKVNRKKGKAASAQSLSTFTTLKGLLNKPSPATNYQQTGDAHLSMPDMNAAPRTPEHVQIMDMDIHNQNICILSPGGSTSIKIPLLGCQDAGGELSEADTSQTINLWEADLNTSVQCSILPENQVTQPLVNSIVMGQPLDIINQMQNDIQEKAVETSKSSKVSKKDPKTGKRKYVRKKKEEDKCGYFSGEANGATAEVTGSDPNANTQYTATPINLPLINKTLVRNLDFGPEAETLPQYRKIVPKPAVSGSGTTVIIVGNQQLLAQTEDSNGMSVLQPVIAPDFMLQQNSPFNEVAFNSPTQQVNEMNPAVWHDVDASNISDASFISNNGAQSVNSSPNSNTTEIVQVCIPALKEKPKFREIQPKTPKSNKYPVERRGRFTRGISQNNKLNEKSVKKVSPNDTKLKNDNDITLVASIDSSEKSSKEVNVTSRTKRCPIQDMKNVFKKAVCAKQSFVIQPAIDEVLKKVVTDKKSPKPKKGKSKLTSEGTIDIEPVIILSDIETKQNGKNKKSEKAKLNKSKSPKTKVVSYKGRKKVETKKNKNISIDTDSTDDESVVKITDKKLKVKILSKKEHNLVSVNNFDKIRNPFHAEKHTEPLTQDSDSSDEDDEMPLSKLKENLNHSASEAKVNLYNSQSEAKANLNKSETKANANKSSSDETHLESEQEKVSFQKSAEKCIENTRKESNNRSSKNEKFEKGFAEIKEKKSVLLSPKKCSSVKNNNDKTKSNSSLSEDSLASSIMSTPKKMLNSRPSSEDDFTPSKESVLEKVGLTPTKSVIGQALFQSPGRVNPLDMLAEWQNSPVSGRKRNCTPNAQNRNSPFKSPSTPKRKTPAKRLFGSPNAKGKRTNVIKKEIQAAKDLETVVIQSAQSTNENNVPGKLSNINVEINGKVNNFDQEFEFKKFGKHSVTDTAVRVDKASVENIEERFRHGQNQIEHFKNINEQYETESKTFVEPIIHSENEGISRTKDFENESPFANLNGQNESEGIIKKKDKKKKKHKHKHKNRSPGSEATGDITVEGQTHRHKHKSKSPDSEKTGNVSTEKHKHRHKHKNRSLGVDETGDLSASHNHKHKNRSLVSEATGDMSVEGEGHKHKHKKKKGKKRHRDESVEGDNRESKRRKHHKHKKSRRSMENQSQISFENQSSKSPGNQSQIPLDSHAQTLPSNQ